MRFDCFTKGKPLTNVECFYYLLMKNMSKQHKINVLLCLDDIKWDYTRHCAVTILSLLETNKKHKIKIFILSSLLPQENIDELKRIVDLYNQEIEFIISDDIVPKELKKVMINKNNLTWGVRYRRFSPKFLEWVDRILCLDCDVLVMKDIMEIYNMDMHWKAIAAYYDMFPFRCKYKIFWINNYINAWVLLFDLRKYDMGKINVKKMEEINCKYSKYFHGSDQDKINIIFKDDIFVGEQEMNYLITNKFFTKRLGNAKIVHCLQKPYVQNSNCPQKIVDLYSYYLSRTKWKWYPKKATSYWNYICGNIDSFCFNLALEVLWDKCMENLILFKRRTIWMK